jgi:type IV pilus assembly protein PilQ
MRIALRLTLLGTFAAIGVALAISLVEMLPETVKPDTFSEQTASVEGLPHEVTQPEAIALTEHVSKPDQSDDQVAAGSESAHSAKLPTPGPSIARTEMTSGESGWPAVASTQPISIQLALPETSPVSQPYRSAFAQDIDALERSIRNLQDSSDQQRSQLRETIDWIKTQPLPSSIREQLDQAPLAPATPQAQPIPVVAQPQEVAPPAGPPPARYKQEIHSAEGDNMLKLNLQNADLREVLDLLGQQSGLNILPSRNIQGNVSATISDVDVETALDALLKSNGFTWRREGPFIYAGTRADLEAIDRDNDRITTRVYRPNYVSAAEIQNLNTNMLTPNIGAVTVSTAAEIDIPADNVHTGGDSFGGQDVVLVRDYESVLLQVDQVVQEIDIRPLQVAIEAMILSVELGDSNELGVNFDLLRQNDNARLVSGGGVEALADLSFDGGLKVGFLDSNLAGFISALERVGQTNVIAKPHLMCLNKQKAEILIGEQLGYVSTTVTENAATQSVEFLEVGTQLRIRPFISSDGMIRMEVHPELSTGTVRVEQNFTLPDKDVTQVTTNIMCRDGATIVIGGLIREDLAQNNSQIPLLGSLPLVGPIFRQQNESFDREELIVLITPRIVREPEACQAGASAVHDFELHQRDFADKMSPLGKRYWGEQYLRKARAAWNAGDASVALRYVNLAIHFDPQKLEATRLREEIVAVGGVGDRSIGHHLKEGLPPWQHPAKEYSRQGYPWVSPPPEGYMEGYPVPEFELGQPGGIRTIEPPRRAESVPRPAREQLPTP